MTPDERATMSGMVAAVAAAKSDTEYAQSPLGLQAALTTAKSLIGSDNHPDHIAALHACIETLTAQVAEASAKAQDARNAELVAAGWTRELTIARRAEMNAAVKSPLFKKVGITGIEKKLGYRHMDLKAAVALYSL
jgi:hypothetical protein